MKCKNCGFWNQEYTPEYADEWMNLGVFGTCKNFVGMYLNEMEGKTSLPNADIANTVVFGDAEGLAFAITGQDFGCTNFYRKNRSCVSCDSHEIHYDNCGFDGCTCSSHLEHTWCHEFSLEGFDPDKDNCNCIGYNNKNISISLDKDNVNSPNIFLKVEGVILSIKDFYDARNK